MVLGKRLIGGLYLFAEELNGGLADLVGIVVSVSGHRKSADRRKELPESSTADPIDEFNADPAQNVSSHPHRDTLHHQSLAHASHQIADSLRCGVPEQTIDYRFLGEIPFLTEKGGDIGNELRLHTPYGREVRQNGQPS